MKDLGIYFDAVETESSFNEQQIGHRIINHEPGNFPIPEKGSICLIYVPEYRNSGDGGNSDYIPEVQSTFEHHYAGEWKSAIYNLGIIRPGATVGDSYLALKDVVNELVRNEVFPLIIGGGQDLMLSIYQAYEGLEQTVNLLDIDPSCDLGDAEQELSDKAWLSKLILHKPTYLFNYTLFGYQSYLTNPKELGLLNKMFFDCFRLGAFYEDPRIIEPLSRNTDILSFDMNAIRSSDYQSNQLELPHGLYGEDACKILRYSGLSDKLTAAGIFNISAEVKDSKQDQNLLAEMLWYFIEGFNQRKRDYPIGSKANYTRFTVSIDDFKDEIIFYKSDKSSRWWMEVPYPNLKDSKFQRHLLIPCNYSDYENALKNELPNLWWKTYEKLS
jgi:formiminoglutamase